MNGPKYPLLATFMQNGTPHQNAELPKYSCAKNIVQSDSAFNKFIHQQFAKKFLLKELAREIAA